MCTDDAVCASYATMFGYAASAGAGPCSTWSPQQMTGVVASLQPPLPVGATLETTCPQSCQSCAPSPPPVSSSACASSPCQNGGTCADRVDGLYTCSCAVSPETGQPMFWGLNCETSEDDCTIQSVSCSVTPRSVCVDCARVVPPTASNPFGGPNPDCPNGYTCDCPLGMEGPECAVDIDECASTPCQNGGTCGDSNSHGGHVAVGAFSCVCTQGWYGETCETSADECTTLPADPDGADSLRAMTCLATQRCTDCANVIGQRMGKPGRPNPDCPNGYTCEACPCPVANGPCPAECPPGGGH